MLKLFFILTAFPLLLSYGQDFKESEMKAAAKRFEDFSAGAYESDTTIDAGYYKINLVVDDAHTSISGWTEIKFKNIAETKNTFFLDLTNKMTVDSIKGEGTKLLFSHEGNTLHFTTHKPLITNEEYRTVVYYHGIPDTGDYASFVFYEIWGEPLIWTLSEPFGAMEWFPCKNTPSDKADSSAVWITCRNDLTAISNGLLISKEDNGNGMKTFKWKSSYPIANYLISITISKYNEYTFYYKYSEHDYIPVQNYYLASSQNDAWMSERMNWFAEVMDYFIMLFGRYPFEKEKYGHVYFGGGGMEHQTITSINDYSNDNLLVHEFAHQWFGNKITCNDWHHIWLNEGFATYAEGLYAEYFMGANFYNNFIKNQMESAKIPKRSLYVEDVSTSGSIFNPMVYYKGALVLHMLRGVVGDEIFFRILKSYANDPELSYGSAVTEDFQRIAEREYGQSLDYFFKEWVYGYKYPKYNVNWIPSQSDGFYNTEITISQQTNTYPVFYTMPIQLLIHTPNGDTTITVFNDLQTQKFIVQTSGLPSSIEFDPANWIMKDLLTIGNEEEPQTAHAFKLNQNYPNPFNPSTKINFSIPASGRVRILIYDLLGKQIAVASDEYFSAGEHTLEFNAANFSSGVYIYKLEWKGRISFKKMMMLK